MHRVPLLVSLALISSTTLTQAQATKVESQLLVTGETGMEFSVSPHGGHVAAVTQKGSRWVVIYDGTPGPLFDEIPNPVTRIVWSPDGTRYAYVGRVGDQYSVMVDGKEQLKVPATSETGIAGIQGHGNVLMTFTPDSKHIFYDIQTVGPGPGGARFRQYQVVYDGVVGPPDQGDGPHPAWPNEGGHIAYLITARPGTALNPGTGNNKELLVVDGKLAPYGAGALQYTADGTHLFSQRTVVIPGKGGATEQLIDGHPVMRAQAIRVFTAPVGNAFVAVVSQQSQPGVNNSFLVVGATRIPGTDCGGAGYTTVDFSADGKHYASLCQADAGRVAMVIDGKKGREYSMITEFAFSPDGAHSMYKARVGMKTFVVTGEAESDGYQLVDSLRFGGAHTGFVGTKASGSTPWEVVIDGKPMPRSDTQALSSFEMSADGAHWAYLTGYGNAVGLVVDGVEQPVSTVRGFARTFRGARFVWSPDGKHFATFVNTKTSPDAGILFDGKFLKLGVNYAYDPTFTPDGRHFLFLTDDPGNTKESIYLDGKVVGQVDMNNSLSDNPATWEVGADGVLTLVAQDAGAIKRFRVTPGTDTSIETLLALGKRP